MFQAMPSQCMMSGAANGNLLPIKLSEAVPAAQTLLGVTTATLSRYIPVVVNNRFGFGLGILLQEAPSQCMVSVLPSLLPTAHTSRAEAAAIPSSSALS